MAANNEERLLSKAIRSRDIRPLIEYGVQEDWFFNDLNRQVWKFVAKHNEKYGEVPTAVTVKENFPTYTLHAVEDNIEYLLDQLVEYRKRQKTIDTLLEAQQSVQLGDHNAAIQTMSSAVQSLLNDNTRESNDENLSENPLERYDEYLSIKTRPNGLLGISTGFKTIDDITAGLLKQQLWTIVAPPKTGKSVLAMQMAIRAQDENLKVMFQSFEMTAREMKTRYDAMRAHISHSRLIRGALRTEEEKRYMDHLSELRQEFWMPDNIAARTITGLSAKIEKFKPDIVFVDGMYLMMDEETGETESERSLRSLTRNMKRVAQRYDVPVVVSTQALRSKMRGGKVTADSIGYTSSFLQDSDIVLALQRQDEEDDSSRSLTVAASRISGMGSTDLMWDWEEGRFEEYAAFSGIKSV
jgi:replicative DNA helicase